MGILTVAFLGDIVGKPGRRVVEANLATLREEHTPDLIVANAENARDGSGLTPAIYEKLRDAGIDAVTLGDHAFRDRRILDTLQEENVRIVRPANLSRHAPGRRWLQVPCPQHETSVVVFTVLGRIFAPLPADDPFACADEILTRVPADAIVLAEAHMEATSEKAALAHHLDGRVAAVIGSHTHVPTADARVMKQGTAFITDVGMCGPHDSVLGRDTSAVLRHFTTALHTPFSVATGDARANGVVVRIDAGSRRALSIERIEYRADS